MSDDDIDPYDGPDFTIMTTAATALSDKWIDIKRSICSLNILLFYLTKPWNMRPDSDLSQQEKEETHAVYVAGCACLDKVRDSYKGNGKDTIDTLAMKTLHYELMKFIMESDRMPAFRDFF
jgi:hypothetical protein